MMATQDNAFIHALAREQNAWLCLIDILHHEEEALIQGDSDKLDSLNEPKLNQLQALGKYIHARNTSLAALGFEPNHQGMSAWVRQGAEEQITALWQHLCACELDAQSLNKRIGTLIEMRLTATRQALNVLLTCATDRGGIYSHDGMALGLTGGRALYAA
jgi:flagella synthesis protein FlgN